MKENIDVVSLGGLKSKIDYLINPFNKDE